MNRDRWLLLVSILIFVGLAGYYLRPGWVAMLSRKKTASVAAKSSSPQPVLRKVAGRSVAEVSVKKNVIDERTPWGRNPFLTEEEEARGRDREDLQVRAIIVGRPEAVAILDGQAVVVGEKVGEETVWEIRPDAVVLERDGRKRMERVSEPSISIKVKERKK
ncbi:MAG: hypothetical protein IH857_08400 [Deltaproteobacteria bacterium]|nr:hypothetical protein [Deltaproteobacteria bacterium]